MIHVEMFQRDIMQAQLVQRQNTLSDDLHALAQIEQSVLMGASLCERSEADRDFAAMFTAHCHQSNKSA